MKNQTPYFQPRKLYLPALVIVSVIFILLVYIGFSTYSNLEHARSNALKFVSQQGIITLQVIEDSIQSQMESEAFEISAVDRLIKKVSKNEYVEYIFMIGPKNELLHHSLPFSGNFSDRWFDQLDGPERTQNRISSTPSGLKVFEIAQKFELLLLNPVYPQNELSQSGVTELDIRNKYNGSTIVIGIKMATYEMAQREDFHHAIVMVAILVILGGGAVFFMFVIALYHRMNIYLREAQEYTRQVVDSMANGLLSIDNEGNVLSYNQLALELVNISESEVDKLILNEVIDFQVSGISKTLSKCESVIDREITIQQSDDRNIPMAVSVTPILTGENTCQGAVIILRDLREIKLLEKKIRQTEKLAALGKLSAAVAHEIRNPLSSIRGFAKFLSHFLRSNPNEKEYADIMVREVDRINRVVTDLINFARPMALSPELVDLDELMQHTVKLVRGDADSKNVMIKLNSENSAHSVFIDPQLITQVILNLILNALQSEDPGHVINVGISMDADLANVSFWVEDDGPGIDKKHLDNIFDPFFTTRDKGTGLGLAIVKKIIESHRGKIYVISPLPSKENGCRFVVSIPLDLEGKL